MRFCVVIVSQDYVNGEWTNHERQSAVERAIKERGREYILPVKVSADIELPGVRLALWAGGALTVCSGLAARRIMRRMRRSGAIDGAPA